MSERRRKYTPEFKDEAVKMVVGTSRPIAEVARGIHVNEGTLGNWVAKYVPITPARNRRCRSRNGRAPGPWRKKTVN